MITRRRAITLGVGAVAAAVAGVGIYSLTRPPSAPLKAKAGLITSLSGEWTIYGIPMHQASLIAVDEINEKGGVLGEKFTLITEDDQTDTRLDAEKARKLIEADNVNVIGGPISSAMREAVTPIINAARMLLLYPTFYEGGVCNKLIFCFGEVPAQQIYPFLPYVMDKHGPNVYIIGADYIWPHVLNEHVKKAVRDKGGRVVGEEYAPIEVSEFAPTIRRIQASKPDIIFSDLAGTAHLAFYKQFVAAGLKGKIAIATPVVDETAVAALGPEVAEGIYSCFAYFDNLDTPRNREFRSKYTARFKNITTTGTIAESMYIGYHMYAMAVNKAGTTDIPAVIKALESGLSFEAPEGRVYLEPETHHLTRTMHIAQVNAQGRFEILKSIPDVPSGEPCKL
jgi:urea transport system substrate-binding protein